MANTYTLYTNLGVLSGANGQTNLTTFVNANIGGDYVAAFYDGEQRARIFDASVTLPTLNASFSPPGVGAYAAVSGLTTAGLYQTYGTVASGNGIVMNVQLGYPYGVSTANEVGQYFMALTYAAGSADAGSPSVFEFDQYLSFLVTTSSTG